MKALAAIAIFALGSGHCFAAAPRLHVVKTMTLAASAAKVWKVTKDFDGLNTWHPAVAKDEIVEGKNNTVGAVRVLTLKDGGTVKERLLAYDAAGHGYKYSILDGVIPVSGYSATFVVKAAGKGKATATWSSSFKRKNLGRNPADNENDQTAVATISGIFQAGLDNLKTMVEAK